MYSKASVIGGPGIAGVCTNVHPLMHLVVISDKGEQDAVFNANIVRNFYYFSQQAFKNKKYITLANSSQESGTGRRRAYPASLHYPTGQEITILWRHGCIHLPIQISTSEQQRDLEHTVEWISRLMFTIISPAHIRTWIGYRIVMCNKSLARMVPCV